MQLSGLSYRDVSDVSVTITNGNATASISLNDKAAWRRSLNRVVTVRMDDGAVFTGVTHAVNGISYATSNTMLTATSVVNLALDEHYRGDTSAVADVFDAGAYTRLTGAYTGVMHAGLDAASGEPIMTDAVLFARRIVSGMSSRAAQRFGVPITCIVDGGNSGKLLDALEWSGQTAGELLSYLLSDVYDVCLVINGTTITLKRFDYANPDAYISPRDVIACGIGFDLQQSTTDVAVESPDITSYSKSSLTLDKDNKYLGVSSKLTSLAGEAKLTGATLPTNYGFDERYSVLRYQNATDLSSLTLTAPRDDRMTSSTGDQGEAFWEYGWIKRQVVIDDDLGRAADGAGVGLLTQTWDRSDETATVAELYANTLQGVAVDGTITVDAKKRVFVGDVVKLQGLSHTSVVMGVSYNSQSSTKLVTLGTTTGSYEDYKGRVRLSEVKQVARDMTPVQTEKLVAIQYYGRVMQLPLSMARRLAFDSNGRQHDNVRILWNTRSAGTKKTDKAGIRARQAARAAYKTGEGMAKPLGTHPKTGATVYYNPK